MFRNPRGMIVVLLLWGLFFSSVGILPARAASLPGALQFTEVASGLSQPDFVTNAGDGSNRLFILQQTGQIRILKNGSLLSTPFLNLSGLVSDFTGANGEQGLLGLAFDPDYASSGIFYITYTTNTGNATFPYTTTLARYHVSGNPDLANTASGSVLLSIPKKYTNHNGGMLAFGPDGYLYMSMGDGGSGGDPDNNAQTLSTLLGKLLRLDVTSTPPAGKKYVIPPTNPFFGSPDASIRQEIWAYGLRNPWRFSFDRSTGDLYIGDVGQDTEEEVDFQSAGSVGGQNYGWHILEGNLCYSPSTNCVPPSGYVAPVATYDHGTNDSYGCSISGGYVYRGSRYPALQGVYFYGDFCSGKVLGLLKGGGSWTHSLIVSTSYTITSFGEDEQGELYLADYVGGKIYQVGSPRVVTSDFDGDGKTDPAKYTPATRTVSWLKSSTGTFGSLSMGNGTFSYVSRSDFDGDGKTDPAKFVPSANALWFFKSTTSTWDGVYMGPGSYDIVAGSDFDGDGKTDPALFLPGANALWYRASNASTWQGVYMGPGSYQVIPGSDFDGDHQADPALFVSAGGANALWYRPSSSGVWTGLYMGPGSYSIVPGSDFDGDGKTDPALFDAASRSLWYFKSGSSTWQGVYMGSGTFGYVAASDFDGDGKTDPAEYVPSTHMMWWLKSTTGTWAGASMGSGTYQIVN